METLYNAEFTYQPHIYPKGRNVTICHLEVLKQGDTALVVATELHSNPGMSITNSSEKLATEVVNHFKLDPAKTTFVEHYNDEISYGSSVWYRRNNPDHYSTVTYTWENGVAKRPQWTSITEGAFNQLRGVKDAEV